MEQVKVGCCGFPKGRRRYFSVFSLVEVQQTFYKPPAVDTVLKWRKEAPRDFEFTIKAWQLITHPPSSPTYRKLGWRVPSEQVGRYGFFCPTDEVLKAWEKTKEIALALKAKVVVFQTPASFTDCSRNIDNMKCFFRRLDRGDFLFVWEPRGDWGESSIISLCRELELSHCVDPLEKMPLYGELKYFRLHGGRGYRHKYSEEELQLLSRLVGGKAYVLFNNISMYDDALSFSNLLRAQSGKLSEAGL
jgi:uncharacterized protein YecE (DUF72 family)